ncbi:MAG: DNA polymerase III subunit delta [Maricaulis sp.]|jgi:DNA polymerase-3 subunit delta|nr:DNA polymerase III subunit delta [Maricaulis sp.]
MKASAREAAGAIARPGDFRAWLIYGPDRGLVRERAAQLAKKLLPAEDDFAVTRLTEDDIKADPASLADAMAAMSLMGGDRLVELRLTNGSAPAATYLKDLEKGEYQAEARLVIEAGDLKGGDALRKAVEASGIAITIPCFADSAADLATLVNDALAEEGLSLDAEARALLVPQLEGDRGLARSEIEKLILYKGPRGHRAEGEDVVTVEDIRDCTSSGGEDAMDRLVEPALAGDVATADRVYARLLAAGDNPVGILRAIQRRLDLIGEAHAGGGPAAAQRFGAPRFGPSQAMFGRHVEIWRGAGFDAAREAALDTERAVKSTGSPAESLVGDLILKLALRASRRR